MIDVIGDPSTAVAVTSNSVKLTMMYMYVQEILWLADRTHYPIPWPSITES